MNSVPFVSIIMPIRNEAAFIRRSLGAVLAQDYPAALLEIIIADGMSTDGTREIIGQVQAQHPGLRLVDNPGRIVPTGLNAAISQARGEIIVRVDGHCEIAPDYVRQCVAELQRTGADNVGGRMSAVNDGSFGAAVALATGSPFGVGGARFHYSEQEEWVDTVYMGAWPRQVFDRVGVFDEEMVRNQDDEFNYRLRKAGGRILLSPKIKSKYTTRSTTKSLWRQYFQYGTWKVRVMQKHPRQMRVRQFVPPAFVLALSGAALFAVVVTWGKWALALIAGAYLVANLAASLWLARREGWSHLLRLPLVFAILHLSYGLGFFIGLLKFWNRWGDKTTKYQPLLGIG